MRPVPGRYEVSEVNDYAHETEVIIDMMAAPGVRTIDLLPEAALQRANLFGMLVFPPTLLHYISHN